MPLDDLTRYPRPNVAVDLALMTVLPPFTGRGPEERLAVLVQHRYDDPTGLVLPGRFLRERQHLVEAVEDVVREKVKLDIPAAAPHFLKLFDDPDRDRRAWTISAAHVLALPYDALRNADGDLRPIGLDGRLVKGSLLFDHDAILRLAVEQMRERYERRPDPYGLLDGSFTLAELRDLHEAVLGERLRKDTFNRRMAEHLSDVTRHGQSLTRSGGGRPAKVYRKRRSQGHLSQSERRRLQLPRSAP